MLTFEPFRVAVPDDILTDLSERLRRTRFPGELAGAGWQQGTDLRYLRSLIGYWLDGYDWRSHEARLNTFPHFLTEVDGQRIHFIHVRSPESDALPLVLVHGWPGSVIEFLDVLGPLTDPRAHGGDPADAFHVVAPSLPGYTFSGPTTGPGWHQRRIASAFALIMGELGYTRYGAQGGDWGSFVCANLADIDADHVVGLHLNLVLAIPPDDDPGELSPKEQANLARAEEFRRNEAGYGAIQGTKPQTLGYALEDSPAGLAAWIVEKLVSWSDGELEQYITRDQMLTNITAYWVTATATSAARLYYEARQAGVSATPTGFIGTPTGVANFPEELVHAPRRWVEEKYNVVYWSELDRGGHFAAMEQPELFVHDVRTFFRDLR